MKIVLTELSRRKIFGMLRWVTSIVLFFLALTKISLLIKYGLDPYRVIIRAAGIPEVFSYYGIAAVIIELYLAIGIWLEKHYTESIISMFILTIIGTALSLVFLIYKINSECGCGLIGNNEWGLLFQKIIMGLVLVELYKNKRYLVFT